MSFTPIPPASPLNWFVRQGGGVSGYPDNGTTYLQGAAFTTLTFSFDDGSPFNLLAVDLAVYSTVAPVPTNVTFYGYRPDGAAVSETFTLDGGIDFETFSFDSSFSGLDHVNIYDFGSLDNVVVSTPEPSAGAILLLGFSFYAARNRILRRRR